MFEILELYDMYFSEFFCVIRFFTLYIFVDEKVNKYDPKYVCLTIFMSSNN